MTPSPETPAQGPGTTMKSSRAAQIHSVRKHEFAMLRELIHKGQGNTSGKVLAGLRSQAVRHKPPSAQTLEKINAIEEQLEQLWRSRVTTVQSGGLGAPTVSQNTAPDAPAATGPTTVQGQASPMVATPASPFDKRSALLRASTSTPLVAPSTKDPAAIFDPVLLSAARAFAQNEDAQAERVLLDALAQSQFPHAHTRNWALALLDLYRTHSDPARFDWAVLEFVQWWSGKTPQWTTADAKPTPWKLQGRLRGPSALELPEVDAAVQETRLSIDCTALLGMDAAASKALRHWLRRAQVRNHVVQFEGLNLMVAALWEQIGLAEAAPWQLRPLP